MYDRQLISKLVRSHAVIGALRNLLVWLGGAVFLEVLELSQLQLAKFAVAFSAVVAAELVIGKRAVEIFLIAVSATISTALILFVYVQATGYRLGRGVGGVGTQLDAVVMLTVLLAAFAFLAVVYLISGLLSRNAD